VVLAVVLRSLHCLGFILRPLLLIASGATG
jgi:hypothetical protein